MQLNYSLFFNFTEIISHPAVPSDVDWHKDGIFGTKATFRQLQFFFGGFSKSFLQTKYISNVWQHLELIKDVENWSLKFKSLTWTRYTIGMTSRLVWL